METVACQPSHRAHIFTQPGDVYDQAAIDRDFNSLWNTGLFRRHSHRT